VLEIGVLGVQTFLALRVPLLELGEPLVHIGPRLRELIR